MKEEGSFNYKHLSFVLVTILVVVLIYFGVGQFKAWQKTQLSIAYDDGAKQGYSVGTQDTVVLLLKQTDNCQLTGVNFGNFSRQVVDAACAKKAVLNDDTAKQGYNVGIQDTVVSLLKQTDNCQITNVNFGNYSRQVVDVACVKKAQ